MPSPVRPPIDPALAPDRRAGLPDDLRVLLARYPREVWTGHANLGELTRFWLSRHDMFRELTGMIGDANRALADGSMPAAEFGPWFAVRMRFLLQQLHGHHLIEDHHYFPVFVAVEERLRRGFDILENDHQVIHERLAELADKGNGLLVAIGEDAGKEQDRVRRAGEAFGRKLDGFLAVLNRHLHDEEDLIVPVTLDRGEESLLRN